MSVYTQSGAVALLGGSIIVSAGGGVPDYYPSGTNPDGVVFPGVTTTDPFAAYSTWYMSSAGVDPTVGSHQAAGYVYLTLQAALNDVFYASGLGARRLVIRSGTYTQTSPAVFPSFSGVAGTPYVVQGDPAYNGLPYFDGGWTSASYVRTGGFISFSGTTSYVTVRKIGIRNLTANAFSGDGTVTNLTIEYCACHDIYYNTAGDSSVAFFGSAFDQAATYIIVRYCNLYTFNNSSAPFGPFNYNCNIFETYGSNNVQISNNYMAFSNRMLRTKLADGGTGGTSGHADSWTVQNNIFSNAYSALQQSTQGNNANGLSNWTVSNNLFYGTLSAYGNGGNAMGGKGELVTAYSQGTNISFTNNTFAEDLTNALNWCSVSSGLVFRDNVVMCSSGTSATVVYTPTTATNFGVVFSQIDYNAYISTGTNPWQTDAAHNFSTFALWQNAYTATSTPCLATTGNPDAHGIWIPNLSASYNTEVKNFPNYATRDYTLVAGSPLLTASSTGGAMGCNMATVGPGWFA
jgi:hypothetical protein